jgi:hypothetical protein
MKLSKLRAAMPLANVLPKAVSSKTSNHEIRRTCRSRKRFSFEMKENKNGCNDGRPLGGEESNLIVLALWLVRDSDLRDEELLWFTMGFPSYEQRG